MPTGALGGAVFRSNVEALRVDRIGAEIVGNASPSAAAVRLQPDFAAIVGKIGLIGNRDVSETGESMLHGSRDGVGPSDRGLNELVRVGDIENVGIGNIPHQAGVIVVGKVAYIDDDSTLSVDDDPLP